MDLVKEEIQRLCRKQYQCMNEIGSLISKHTCMLASRTKSKHNLLLSLFILTSFRNLETVSYKSLVFDTGTWTLAEN